MITAIVLAALPVIGQLIAFGFEFWRRFNDKSIGTEKKKDAAQASMDKAASEGDHNAFLKARSDKHRT